ncbi:MAG: MobA/MobL family protein [Mitsuokella sp.]|uniref:MobA/MobL family protein n=1 Tax=Mitsuokella sp. TaxID=2049034 RepID=UPI003F022C6F
MALYYFTIKNDKKPGKFGTPIKATEHASYIERQGKYENIDEKDPKNQENVITTEGIKDAVEGNTLLLYDSPFGSITNTKKGLVITDDPSPDTIAIAMMVAQRKMPGPLVIRGSELFQAKCVHAALVANLPVSFADENLQAIFEKKKEERKHEREEYRRQGGKIIRAGILSESDAPVLRTPPASVTPPKTISSLRKLSELHVVPSEQQPKRVLQRDEKRRVGFDESTRPAPVRWSLSWARRERARIAARRILKNIDANKEELLALRHVEYINREKAFKKKGGCVYTQHRLPKWAKDSPNVFFRAADRYSPKKSDRYKEVVFALQNELTLEQNLEIVNRFIDEVLPNHYYTLAVHDKVGSMGNGETHNLHVHLMFSPRIIDDVEKKKERKRSDYFSYPLRKNAKDQSEEAKRTHGAPTDRKWSDKKETPGIRATFADITNDVLRKYGFRTQVDHRSLKAQEQEALQNGDTLLAKILHRIPEQHIGNFGVMREDNPLVETIKKYRIEQKEYLDLLFQADVMEHDLAKKEHDKKEEKLQDDAKRVIDSQEFQESDLDASTRIGKLRTRFLNTIHDYEHKKEMLVSPEDALEEARLEYMTSEERNVYLRYKHLLEEQEHWKTFEENLQKPDTKDADALQAFQELGPALKEKQKAIADELTSLKESVDTINIRLKNPDIEKQIQLLTHKALEENRKMEPILQKAEKALEYATRDLNDALQERTVEENMKDSYTLSELYGIIKKRLQGRKRNMYRLKRKADALHKKIISPFRALDIAKDVYSKGELKKLRAFMRKLEKNEKAYEKENGIWHMQQNAILMGKKIEGVTLDSLMQRRTELDEWNRELIKKRQLLENSFAHWDELFRRPEINKKLQEISAGILRKNEPVRKAYLDTMKDYTAEKAHVDFTQKLLNNILRVAKQEGDKPRMYRTVTKEEAKAILIGETVPPSLTQPKSKLDKAVTAIAEKIANSGSGGQSPIDRPSMIAEALMGNNAYAQLVAVSKDDDMGLKNWSLMSEAQKEEEFNKNFYANL